MCRTECLLALVAVYVGLAHSWDLAVGARNQLIFYTDGTETYTVNFLSQINIVALAYDEVHNRMLYVDRQSNYDAICGYISSRENKCFIKRAAGSIHSIAFDPATETLFFSDTNDKSINWISFSGSANNVEANLLIKIDNGSPTDISVDSCRRYIYWTNTNTNYLETIERVQYNGSGRETILDSTSSNLEVLTQVMDPLTQKMYYFDYYFTIYDDVNEYLHLVDLNGQDDRVIYNNYGVGYDNYYRTFRSQRELKVSKDYLYWVHSCNGNRYVWQYPKDSTDDSKPAKNISHEFSEKETVVIATNYKLEDQLRDCEPRSSPAPMITVTDNSLNMEQTTEYKTDVCNCTPTHTGERCEVSLCQNYCLHGNCSLHDEGLPTCRCNASYTGERCEVYTCHGYCLNGGDCSLNEKDEPVCQCAGNHEGTRCEAVKYVTFTISNTSTSYSTEINLDLDDLMANWRKPRARVTVTVEV